MLVNVVRRICDRVAQPQIRCKDVWDSFPGSGDADYRIRVTLQALNPKETLIPK